jgi:hypothetical protein
MDNSEYNNSQGKWTNVDEKLLKEWADHASCYKILHEMGYKKYNIIHTGIQIPIIILSTITGAASFAISKINDDTLKDVASMIIGVLNIITGILGTCYAFFKVGERKENHNNCSKQWDKIYRFIQVELAKERHERMPKKSMMEFVKKEYERVMDASPILPDDVIVEFLHDIKMNDVAKPNILRELFPVIVNKEESKVQVDPKDEAINKFVEINGRKPTEMELTHILEMKEIIIAK